MSRGVPLGQSAAAPPRVLYVPPGCGYEDRPVIGKCFAPGCGAIFYAGQLVEWQQHAAKCGAARLDEIRALAPSHANRGSIFSNDGRDLEIESHFRRVRGRMERDGDWEVKANERAGFS